MCAAEGARTRSWGLGLARALAGVAAASAVFPGSSLAVEAAPPGFLELLLVGWDSLLPWSLQVCVGGAAPVLLILDYPGRLVTECASVLLYCRSLSKAWVLWAR